MQRIATRQSVTLYPYAFAEELNVIKCPETGKEFGMKVVVYYDSEKGYYANPTNEYSYCPHCGAKLDLWEGRKNA